MMFNFSRFALSVFQFTRFLFSKRVHVIFYYSQVFNRGMDGDNLFFRPMIKACQESGVSYLVLEQPANSTFKRRKGIVYVDCFFYFQILLNKICILFDIRDLHKRAKVSAAVTNVLTFGKFRVPCIITISKTYFELWSYLNPNGRIFDYQHGIINNLHPGFFDREGKIKPDLLPLSNTCYLMFGQEFYKYFFINRENNFLVSRVFVVGIETEIISLSINDFSTRDTIVFSLQFAPTDKLAWMFPIMLEGLDNALNELSGFAGRVLLRHHPRFANDVDMDPILRKYPNVKITTSTIQELHSQTLLHITATSTSAFEWASWASVPTFFISKGLRQYEDTFYKDYNYPLYKDRSINEVVHYLSEQKNWERDSAEVHKWSRFYFLPFSPSRFLDIIRNDKCH